MNHAKRLTMTLLCLTVLFPAMHLMAQETGSIQGRITNEMSEGVPGIAVRVVGGREYSVTNTDGDYEIRGLVPGMYAIFYDALGYRSDTIRGLTVTAGGAVSHMIALQPDETLDDGQTTVVTGKRSENSKAGALTARREALSVTEVQSAEEIRASGASDAGDAVKRQTGASVVGGKYVVVRGIPERYNNTQLNGVSLPSPEPEKKVVPFDLFPAGMIDNIMTIKTFTPDNPGDFAGGLVKIQTKDFPKRLIFSAGIGAGFNSSAQGGNGLGYAGGSTDWLGVDDGGRSMPANITPGRRFSSQEQAALLSSFDNAVWRPTAASIPINSSFNVTIGNTVGEDTPIGILFSTSYSNSYSTQNGEERHPLIAVDDDGAHVLRYNYTTNETGQSVLWGSLLNLSIGLGESGQIGLKGFLNHTADDEATEVYGDFNSSTSGQVRRTQLRYVERTIAGAQLLGEHTTDFLAENAKIEWRAALSMAQRNEPDNRQTSYLRNDASDLYRYSSNFASGNGRFYSDLNDLDGNAGVDLTLPINVDINDQPRHRLKFGTSARVRTRDFAARRFYFAPGTEYNADALALDPEQLFTPENVSQGYISFNDNTLTTDSYNADEQIVAGYGMIEATVVDRLRLIAGARLEWWNVDLVPFNQISSTAVTNLETTRTQLDVLPSINLIYSLSQSMSLRGAFSQTLARPEFRELAPFRFDDYKQSTFGNPGLERTLIRNYDLRWEVYPRAGELVAVSGFFKDFSNPIEQFYLLGGSDIQVESVNAPAATTIGAEIEIRKSLDDVASFLEGFSAGINGTLSKSSVRYTADEKVTIYNGFGLSETPATALTSLDRPLQGQSPYVVNFMLGYGNKEWGTEATLLFNVFGERLAFVGTNGIPDVYEQPRPTLDMTVRQKLPAGLSLSLKGANLLDAETLYTQEFSGENAEVIETNRYFSGRSLSLGLSFNLDQLSL